MIPKITNNSEKCMNYYQYYKDLERTESLDIVGRIFYSRPSRKAIVSFSSAYSKIQPVIKKEVIHLGSYNYSGLNDYPEIIEEASLALKKYGTTSSGVRHLNGTFDLHLALEARLAKFIGNEACMTFSSGYSANISVLEGLCDSTDIVFSDQLNHQSINDGLKLSGTKVVVFKHSNMSHLETKLAASPKEKRKFIITDGVFSMDGDLANLPEITRLAKKYNAMVIVDDAHGVGAVGPNGKGTVAHFGLENDVDIILGSLSKGLPGIGGFVVARKETIETLYFGANSYIFSASLPPVIVASLIKAIDILESSPDIQEQLHENEKYLREGLQNLGFNTMSSNTPIIPILIADEVITKNITRTLHEHGIYVNPVGYPAVNKKSSRLRINVSASLTKTELDIALAVFQKVGAEYNLIPELVS